MTDNHQSSSSLATDQRPALPDFAYLIKAAKERIQGGDLEEAEVMLDEARKQAVDHPQRQTATAALEQEIEDRRKGREDGIQRRLRALQECLDQDELMLADRLLYEAIEDFGLDERFEEPRRRLQARHLQGLEAKIDAMVIEAQRLSNEHRDVEALELLHTARSMAPPQHQALQERLAAVTETLQRLTREHRLQRLTQAQQEIEHCLQAYDLAAAKAAAAAAESDLTHPETVATLRRHLQLRISQSIHTAVQAAGQAFDARLFGFAVTHLRQALALKPDDPWLQKQLQQASARQVEQEKDLVETDAAWRDEIRDLETAIAEHRFVATRLRIDAAEARWGQGATLDALRQKLEDRCQEQVRESLRAARQAHLDGETETAEGHVQRALCLAPEDPSALNLAQALRRPQPKPPASQATPEVAATLRELDQLCEQGKFLDAWRVVQAAIESFGELEPLQALQRHIAQEMVDGF